MLFLEIQEGKIPMRRKKFMGDAGMTAGTSLRLVEGSEYSGQSVLERVEAQSQGSKRPLVCADSWFGSVRLVECLKCMYRETRQPTALDRRAYKLHVDKERGNNANAPEAICSIKSNTGMFPFDALKKEMEPFPSGAYLVMECLAPETNVKLVAIGYKYNSRKTLLFCMSKDAETTEPGFPYVARFPDEHGNVRERRILRPKCLSIYFEAANLIDVHNHLRQGVLRLEMLWKTPNPWFRLITTIIGITVVDCFLATKYHVGGRYFPVASGIEQVADYLAWDLTHNKFSNNLDRSGQVNPSIVSNLVNTASGDACGDMSITERATRYARQMLEDAFAHQFGGASSRGVGARCPAPISIIDLQSTDSIPVVSPMESLLSGQDGGSSTGTSDHCLPCNSRQEPPAGLWVHQPMHNPDKVKDPDGKIRPSARHCVICGYKTRLICAHSSCRAKSMTRKIKGKEELKILWGVPICNSNIIREDFDKPCVEVHRIRMEALQLQQQNTA